MGNTLLIDSLVGDLEACKAFNLPPDARVFSVALTMETFQGTLPALVPVRLDVHLGGVPVRMSNMTHGTVLLSMSVCSHPNSETCLRRVGHITSQLAYKLGTRATISS